MKNKKKKINWNIYIYKIIIIKIYNKIKYKNINNNTCEHILTSNLQVTNSLKVDRFYTVCMGSFLASKFLFLT